MKSINFNEIVNDTIASLPQLQKLIDDRFGNNAMWVEDAYRYLDTNSLPSSIDDLLSNEQGYKKLISSVTALGVASKFNIWGPIGISLASLIAEKIISESDLPGYKTNLEQIEMLANHGNISPESQIKILKLALLITLAELEQRDRRNDSNKKSNPATTSEEAKPIYSKISEADPHLTKEAIKVNTPQYVRRPRTGRPKIKYDRRHFRQIVLSMSKEDRLQHPNGSPNIRAIAEELKSSKREDINQMSISSLRNRVKEVFNN